MIKRLLTRAFWRAFLDGAGRVFCLFPPELLHKPRRFPKLLSIEEAWRRDQQNLQKDWNKVHEDFRRAVEKETGTK